MEEVTYQPINLIGDHSYGPVRKQVTIAQAAGVVAAGTVLGRIAVSGKMIPYLTDASDGSQNPVAVLLHDIDATVADVSVVVGFNGVYVRENITGLDTDGELALEARGVHFTN